MTNAKTYRVGFAASGDGVYRVCWRLVSARSSLNYVDGPPITSELAAELAAGYYKRALEFAGMNVRPGLEFYPA